jgi:hypothetical protein
VDIEDIEDNVYDAQYTDYPPRNFLIPDANEGYVPTKEGDEFNNGSISLAVDAFQMSFYS